MKISFSKLLLAFLIIPFVELYLLFKIAEYTTPMTTFGIIILTGFVGAYFAKQQGQRVISSIQRDVRQGQMPAENLMHGLCVLIGGILLLTPGILTDMLGFLLVFPISRKVFVAWFKLKFSNIIKSNTVHIYSNIKTDDYRESSTLEYETMEDDSLNE